MGPHDLLLGLLSPAGRVDPYPYYRDLIERWPVLPITRERLLVTGYQECVDVLVNPRLFPVPDRHCADRLWPAWRTFPSTDLLYRSLLFRNAPDNQPARRLLARFFGPDEVARMRPMITRHAEAGTAPFGAARAVVDATRTFTTIPNGSWASCSACRGTTRRFWRGGSTASWCATNCTHRTRRSRWRTRPRRDSWTTWTPRPAG